MDHDIFVLPDLAQVTRVSVRLGAAAILGGAIGYERERLGKAAGLRTHVTVALGAALFVIVIVEAGAASGDLSRVVQGIAAGIGFIGAGAILKRAEREEIHGLTTAAIVWLTAAVGVAAGAGQIAVAGLCVVIATVILIGLGKFDQRQSNLLK